MYGWLADFYGHSLQQACINLDGAFKNFFEKRARFPRFKRRRGSQSSYHCTGKLGFGADWVSIPSCRVVSMLWCTARVSPDSSQSR
jgi:putative transposase